MEESDSKRLATLPSKLIALKQDVITELGIDVSQVNDELLCHILAKEIELHQINFVFGKGKHKTPYNDYMKEQKN